MPPRKRARADAESSAQSGPSKGSKKSKKASDADSGEDCEEGCECHHEDSDNRAPYEYYCLQRPFYDYEKEKQDKDDEADEDDIGETYNTEVADAKDNPAGKPLADYPDHKWFSMWKSWTKYCEMKKLAFYTCPDVFGMYIYNDFNGYGVQELVQNTLINFDKEFKKKKGSENRLDEMWCIASSFVHWLLQDDQMAWHMMDDGALFHETTGMISLMFLAMLNELDQADLLKPDSRIKDLSLVMACYLYWAETEETYGGEDFDFPKVVIGYAKKAGIELEESGPFMIKEVLENNGDIDPLPGKAKADRWSWKKKFNAFKRDHGVTFGERFNILKMSRKERASYAFDKKDPFKDLSDKDLREGVIMPA